MKKILVILLLLPLVVFAASTIDSYSETNRDDFFNSNNRMTGQSFSVTSNATLTSAQFYVQKNASPTGNVLVYLYAHSGTYGVSSVPGALLATSDAVDVTTFPTSFGLVTFTFTGAQQYAMTAGTKYLIVIDGGGLVATAFSIGDDITSPTHAGNSWDTADGALASTDVVFYVFGTLAPPTFQLWPFSLF